MDVSDDWVAARRLVSSFHSGAADNLLSTVAEIDAADRWRAVAMALTGEVATLADLVHGANSQDWLDGRIALSLNRCERPE